MINYKFKAAKAFFGGRISKFMLIIVFICLMLPVAGCRRNGYTSVVRVYTSKNCFSYSLVEEFEKKNNIKVLYKVFKNADEMWEVLKNSPELCDVVIGPQYVLSYFAENNLLAPVDKDKIPNLSLADSLYADFISDEEKKYYSVLFFEVLGILYNKSLVLEGGVNWDTLWDIKYSRQIIMPDNAIDLMNTALKTLGFSINTKSYVEIKKAMQKILSQKEMVDAYNKVGIKSKFQNAEAVIAAIRSTDAIKLMEDLPQVDFNFIIPHQGTNMDFHTVGIMDSSKRKGDCMKFINYLYSTEVSSKLTEYTNLSFVNKESKKAFLSSDSKFSDIFYPPSYVMERCEIFKSYENMVYERNKSFNQVTAM